MSVSESEPLAMFLYAIKSDETKRKYVKRLEDFFDFVGLKGTMEEKSKQFVAKARGNSPWLLSWVMKFIAYQKTRAERAEISESTIPNYTKPIKLFLEMNDIPIAWKRISRGIPRGRRFAIDRTPTIEEIRKIIEYPDRRIKAIVYTMCSSGIRLGAWDYLKWKHVVPIERDGVLLGAKIIVYPGDEEQYFSFITPEAYHELKKWMEFRESCHEKITGESWLMRDIWDIEKFGRGIAKLPKQMTAMGVKSLMERALTAQGIRKKLPTGQKRFDFQTNHGFRKWFKTRAEQVMKPINVEVLLGHSTGISDSYYRPNENELFSDYCRAIPLLQVSEVEEVRQEFSVAERSWKSQFDEMRQNVATIQSQLSFLTSAVVAAKSSSAQA